MQQSLVVLDGRYELGTKLGEGGMAQVFRATDLRRRRPVAVKVLAEPYCRDRRFVERFRREAESASSLHHPNIVEVLDSGSDGGTQYLVMELVDGPTLAERLRAHGALDDEETVRIGAAVARALAEAHEHGIVHRDVKPGNIMLAPDGTVKVVDFGIARASNAERLTHSGLVVGSAPYLSPEQAQGESGDARSDLYGLGCVLYEMLTGSPPFVGDDPVAVLYQHVNAPPPSLPAGPGDLQRIVSRCLEKDPRRRFDSAHALEAALLEGSPGPPVDTTTMPLPTAEVHTEPIPVSRPPRRREGVARRWWAIGAIAALLIIATVAAAASGGSVDPAGPVRDARRAAVAYAERSAVDAPAVTRAYADLVSVIRAAEIVDAVDAKVATELRGAARSALDAYASADLAGVDGASRRLRTIVTGALDEGTMSPFAAETILARLDEFTGAISRNPPPTPPAEEEPAAQDEPSGDGNAGQGHGPPAHAEANGHDD